MNFPSVLNVEFFKKKSKFKKKLQKLSPSPSSLQCNHLYLHTSALRCVRMNHLPTTTSIKSSHRFPTLLSLLHSSSGFLLIEKFKANQPFFCGASSLRVSCVSSRRYCSWARKSPIVDVLSPQATRIESDLLFLQLTSQEIFDWSGQKN